MTKSRKAAFLDRDGTIIRQVELLVDLKKVKLLPGAAQAIKALNEMGFLVVVVTNQPVVARGLITQAGIRRMNRFIARQLLSRGARIDAFYFCPHHPHATLKRYRRRCSCRKPGAGMIRKAMRRYGIRARQSFMVGDGIIDVVAGKRAGVKTILVKSGPGHRRLDTLYDAKPDFISKDLFGAVRVIRAQTRKK